jgi:hypothetical protein
VISITRIEDRRLECPVLGCSDAGQIRHLRCTGMYPSLTTKAPLVHLRTFAMAAEIGNVRAA